MAGLYFEEFAVGQAFDHAWTRTVTEMDNVLFSSLTMNVQPLHLDEEFCKTTIHKQRVVNSLFTVALIGAFHVPELTMGTTLGNLGFADAAGQVGTFIENLRFTTGVADDQLRPAFERLVRSTKDVTEAEGDRHVEQQLYLVF